MSFDQYTAEQLSHRPPFPGNVFLEGCEFVEVPEDHIIERNGISVDVVKTIIEDNNKLRKELDKLREKKD